MKSRIWTQTETAAPQNGSSREKIGGPVWTRVLDTVPLSLRLECPAMIEFRRDVDPDLAELLVEARHPNQRRIIPNSVKKMADDMARGLWIPEASNGFVLDSRGLLIQGQHTASAIVSSGVTLHRMPFMLLKSDAGGEGTLARRVFALLDVDRKRTVMDAVAVSGGMHRLNEVTKEVVAGIRFAESGFPHHKNGKLYSSSNIQVADFITGVDPVTLGTLLDLRALNKRRATGSVCAAIWASARVNNEDCRSFWTAVLTGDYMVNGQICSPARALAMWLENPTARLRQTAVHSNRNREYASRCIRAWNAWRRNQDLQKVPKYDPDWVIVAR